ncbi:hypothetical protein LIPSTDRAFT_151753 [Lipomyces starkeyi NRRL Y-11557]|uniref:Uncharacterized protein n=1 Tax=Lipomyces starkeyi NRRL Y-11557 TaxID=675824 RepID=A0A1E3Q2M8_LIPST|nr:hypothetical protein LIPSTDRAFT_151753 [Lipomyces starkeyi NRRL Y-11557]
MPLPSCQSFCCPKFIAIDAKRRLTEFPSLSLSLSFFPSFFPSFLSVATLRHNFCLLQSFLNCVTAAVLHQLSESPRTCNCATLIGLAQQRLSRSLSRNFWLISKLLVFQKCRHSHGEPAISMCCLLLTGSIHGWSAISRRMGHAHATSVRPSTSSIRSLLVILYGIKGFIECLTAR